MANSKNRRKYLFAFLLHGYCILYSVIRGYYVDLAKTVYQSTGLVYTVLLGNICFGVLLALYLRERSQRPLGICGHIIGILYCVCAYLMISRLELFGREISYHCLILTGLHLAELIRLLLNRVRARQ